MIGPTLHDIIADLGHAGKRLWHIDAAEGAAGNMSVFVRQLQLLDEMFAPGPIFTLPVQTSNLIGGWVVVTGSARRMYDITDAPESTLCLLHILDDGKQAKLYSRSGLRPTSELNSHLAIHNDHVARRGLDYHAVVHAQPLRLTYLTHLERYADILALNRRLMRWQPETIMEFPEGIGVLPFQVPASAEQMHETMAAMQLYRAVVWRHHGIVTRADTSVGKAADLVEYAEAAARYEHLNLQAGEPASGLADDQLRLICDRLGITQPFFIQK